MTTHNKIQFIVLLLLLTTSMSVYVQRSLSSDIPAVKKVAAPPTTARNFRYPQSLFVDSHSGNIWVADFDNNRVMRFDVSSLTSVSEMAGPLRAEQYKLAQNYPNPFNPSTTITFAMRTTGHATVTVYDLLGRKVATPFNGLASAHTLYALTFDARNLSSGVYYYKLTAGAYTATRKMIVAK